MTRARIEDIRLGSDQPMTKMNKKDGKINIIYFEVPNKEALNDFDQVAYMVGTYRELQKKVAHLDFHINIHTERKELSKAVKGIMKMMDEGRIGVLAIREVSELSESEEDIKTLLETCERNGVKLINYNGEDVLRDRLDCMIMDDIIGKLIGQAEKVVKYKLA